MATEQSTKGTRANRRLSKLIAHLEGLLASNDEQASVRAAEKLGDILMRQAELRDRQAEREFKREMRSAAFTPTAPASTPQSLDETIRQLRLEVARKKAQDEEIDPFA
jgi:hypothetical protein